MWASRKKPSSLRGTLSIWERGWLPAGRNGGGSQTDQIGIDLAAVDQGSVPSPLSSGTDLSLLFDGLDIRRILRLVTDEDNALVRRLLIIILLEPVSPHVPIQDINVHLRV